MTAFLEAQLPKIYRLIANESFSKVAFVSRLCKALVTVGMIPLVSTWPFDVIAEPERVTADGVYLFAFDYPDNGTFRVGQTLYRPCIVVALYIGETSTTTNPTRLVNYVVVEEALRADGAVTLANIRNKTYDRGSTANQGFGTSLSQTHAATFPDSEGGEIQKADWLPYVGFGGTDLSPISTGHWFVYLGPGGLFIYIGTDTTRAAFGDRMSIGFMSLGERIEGRALPVLEDGNLNRLNPMVYFPMRATGSGSDIWNTQGGNEFLGILRTKVHGMQHNTKTSLAPVDAFLLNLENVEYPLFPSYAPDTRPSPREVEAGVGAHILGVPVLIPDALESDANNLFGPLVPTLAADAVRPKYSEVFTGRGFRLCDISAPLGQFVDPYTNLNWYLVPTYNTNQQVGLSIEPSTPSTITDVLDFGVLSLSDVDIYSLTGADGWTNGVFATPVTITPNVGQSWWNDDSVLDKMEFVVPASASTQTSDVEWIFSIDAGDPPDTVYQLQFNALNRDDPQAGAGDPEGFNALTLDVFNNGAFVTGVTIECAGNNPAYVNSAGKLSYSSQTYTVFVTKDTSTTTPRLRVRWRQNRNGSNRACNGEVSAIRINKFRYL